MKNPFREGHRTVWATMTKSVLDFQIMKNTYNREEAEYNAETFGKFKLELYYDVFHDGKYTFKEFITPYRFDTQQEALDRGNRFVDKMIERSTMMEVKIKELGDGEVGNLDPSLMGRIWVDLKED